MSLPLTSKPYKGDVVYNFFENLLPEHALLRERIQARFNTHTAQPFDLLNAIGRDCVGAIQLCPELPQQEAGIRHSGKLNDEDIAKILEGYEHAPLGMFDDKDDFRISLAGYQEKTALLAVDGGWAKPIGETPTTHIFKLPMGLIGDGTVDFRASCENEFICMKLAKAFGLPVPDVKIGHFGNKKALIVERFDRRYSDDGKRIFRLPQEDFCQSLGTPSAKKYQSDGGPGIDACMTFLSGSLNSDDKVTFFKSQVLFWLLAAIDGHGKNFSVFLLPDNRYQMTPFYDIMSAYTVMGKKGLAAQKIKMAMSLKGSNVHWHWKMIQKRHFIRTGRINGISEVVANQIIDDMFDNIDCAIDEVANILPDQFDVDVADKIFAGIQNMKKRKGEMNL